MNERTGRPGAIRETKVSGSSSLHWMGGWKTDPVSAPCDESGLPGEAVVAGVMVRLSRDPHLREAALAALAGHPAICTGERTGRWLTLAIEAPDASEGRDLHAWLLTVPGIEWVEVISVFFDGAAENKATQPAWEVSA